MSERKKPLGGGSPRFRKSNQKADGSFPVPPPRAQKPPIDLSEDKDTGLVALRDSSAHEAIRHLRWQMRNAPSIRAKERAARKLAELGTPKPPQRIESTGKDGGPVENEVTVRFVRP